jgi:hypothetical protein
VDMMPRTGKIWIRTGLALSLALSVGACGVKSQPSRPDGSSYPKHYPTPLPELETVPKKQGQPQAPGYDPDGFYQYPNQPPKQ